MMLVKVTADFLIRAETTDAAKDKLNSMLKHTIVPHYDIRPQTEVKSIEGD